MKPVRFLFNWGEFNRGPLTSECWSQTPDTRHQTPDPWYLISTLAHFSSLLSADALWRVSHFCCLAYRAYWEEGEIDLKEHDDFKWISLEQLAEFDFAPADLVFVEKLQNGEIAIHS